MSAIVIRDISFRIEQEMIPLHMMQGGAPAYVAGTRGPVLVDLRLAVYGDAFDPIDFVRRLQETFNFMTGPNGQRVRVDVPDDAIRERFRRIVER